MRNVERKLDVLTPLSTSNLMKLLSGWFAVARCAGGCALAFTLAVQAQNPVTFRVDMSVKKAEGVFLPEADTVSARGSFNEWGATFTLAPSAGNADIYEGTVDVGGAVGNTVEFKFVYNNGADQWETRGNRSFVIQGGAQTLDVVYYDDDATVSVMATTAVTFQVDMSVKIAEGLFDPAADELSVRGSFNSWGRGNALSPTVEDPNLYTGTFDITALTGDTILYKFVIYHDAADQWEGDPNRSFAHQADPVTLPAVYFDRDEEANVVIKAAIAFQVDMSVQLASGNFDPATDEVWVRGNRMGWGTPPGGVQLFADASRAGVYTNLYTRDEEVTGSLVEYKHTIWQTDAAVTVWEDGANKTLMFTGDEPVNPGGYHVITAPLTYFNGIAPSDVLAADTLVTFRVNMSAAQSRDGTPFDPLTQGVWVNGSFVPWWTWATQPAEYQALDDGTAGDAVAGDKIYTWQHLFARGASTRLEYKYGIDSVDNEAASGSNHVRYIRALGSYVMPVDVFGTMTAEAEVGSLAIGPVAEGQVTLTWNGRPGVRLQSAAALGGGGWAEVPGTDGQSQAVVPVGPGARFFRLIK